MVEIASEEFKTIISEPHKTVIPSKGKGTRRGIQIGRVAKPTISVASVASIIGLWWLISGLGLVSRVFLPAPNVVWSAGWGVITHGYQGISFWRDAYASLYRVIIGLVAGCVIGIPLGLLMGRIRIAHAIVNPLIQLFRPIPPLAYLTLLIIWFGIGNEARIILLYLAALPIVTIGAMQAAKSVREEQVNVARSFGGSSWQIFRYVVIPGTRAEVLTTVRVATGVTFTTLVAAEMIGANTGLGAMDLNASRYLQSPIVLFSIIVLGIAGLALDMIVVAIDRWLVPWRGKV